jgi:hypothetical protein
VSYSCRMTPQGQSKDTREHRISHTPPNKVDFDSFVLEKGIFSNIFEKDIRRFQEFTVAP